MRNAKQLGELYADVLYSHDQKSFKRLAATASEMFSLLGHDSHVSSKAGKLVSEAYVEADKAERSRASYSKVFEKLLEVERLLGAPEGVAFCQMRWWQEFRNQNWLLVLYYLFRQHLKAFGIFGAHRALLCTYYLALVGKVHHYRKSAAGFASKYFQTLLSAGASPFIG